MRHAAKVDTTHRPIALALEAAGAFVQSLAAVGGGCPDLLVRYMGVWYVMEVKTGKEKLRQNQIRWWWKCGTLAPVVVRTPDEALRVIGAVR